MLLASLYTKLLRRLTYQFPLSLTANRFIRTRTFLRYTNLNSYAPAPQLAMRFRKFSNSPDTSVKLVLQDSYVSRFHQLSTEPNQFIRLSVEGGGCSGFQYEFSTDTHKRADDVVIERAGAKLVIDAVSLELLQGASVEFHEELIRSSFRVVDIPKAESGCSCGASFALKT